MPPVPGGLVLLPLADHHRSVDGQLVQRHAHRVDGGLVGGLVVTAPQPAARRDRGLLGDREELGGADAPRLVGVELGHRQPREAARRAS
jgi:hypothetical protein